MLVRGASLRSLSKLFINTFNKVSFFNYQYDLFVIGGGSGGLSASKQAAKLKKKVGLADYVAPSPKGAKWGVGGTCVNVGCIPKKMMHYAGGLYENLKMYGLIGYNNTTKFNFNWSTLVDNVQNHIKSLNFGYQSLFVDKNIVYYNKYAKFIDKHTLELNDENGKKEIVTADKILITTGGRPKYSNLPGEKENCISSDDLFSLQKPPGKTLIVGASYIALECGGILRSFGYDTSIMVRSILLRGFDQIMANKIGQSLSKIGVKFIKQSVPISYHKTHNNKIKVIYKDLKTKKNFTSEEYDTVLLAIGRTPNTSKLNLDKIGVKVDKRTKKILTNKYDQTNIDNIYAIGDVAFNRPELTPPAIRAGKLLVNRLFTKGTIEQNIMNYDLIPTTVFTPIEYGSCGLSEEKAIAQYGTNNIKIYHSEFVPVEWTFDIDNDKSCYIKLIVRKKDNKVIGFHILSPHAGEITQGVAVAMKMGLTKQNLDSCIGIHPTIAEEMTTLEVTTEEGDGKKGGC